MSRQAVPARLPADRTRLASSLRASSCSSGEGPLRDGVYIKGTIAEETHLTLDNLLAVLAASGCSAEDVVRCGVWLTDLADFAEMNRVCADVFPYAEARAGDRPGRTLVGRVEIDCIAVVPT